MKALHPLPAALLCACALAATVALSADLGQRDAAAQFAARGAPLLRVYSCGEPDASVLDAKAVAALRTVAGVRAAVAVAEVPVTLGGLGYTLPATAYAVAEEDLKSLSLPLQSGALPRSAWRVQALAGGTLAQRLAEAANRVGRPLPGAVRLSVSGGDVLDARLSGIACVAGAFEDDGLWLDEDALRMILPVGSDGQPAQLATSCIVVEARGVAAAQSVEKELRTMGYLVDNPVSAPARTLEDGAAMARQWAVLAVLLGLAAAGALWRRPPRNLWSIAVAVACAAAGVALAGGLMQTAMLLGARFFLSADARYLLDAPRLLAVPLEAAALAALACAAGQWKSSAV